MIKLYHDIKEIVSKSKIAYIFSGFLLLYFILIIHLYKIQIYQADFFQNYANNQYLITLRTSPERAGIFDRNNIQIALNKEGLSAFILPNKLQEPELILKFLKHEFPDTYNKIVKNKTVNFMYIKRHLSDEQIDILKQANLKDIQFLKEPSRYYPYVGMGQIVGLTDPDNQGIFGVEQMYDKQLSGIPTTITLKKDARSGHFFFNELDHEDGLKGQPVQLTIDSTLQFLAFEEVKETVEKLKASEGAAIIMDPTNGDIIAMANYPDFDYTQDKNKQISKNLILSNSYELGSVIKMFCALAAIEENLFKPTDIIDCENKLSTTINGYTFSTYKAHGKLSFSEVIENSNNIGTAKIALKLGPLLYDHYAKLGFGKKLNIFAGENKGSIIPVNQWTNGTPIVLSFGYSISATLLQLAQAMTPIANNGYLIKPRLIKSNQEPEKIKLYKPESIDIIRDILSKTVTNGTANRAQIKNYNIMGKTGTARLLKDGKYDPDKLIFTFAGILEKDNYKRIIITFIKEANIKNAFASTIAVPLFEKIAKKMLIHDKIL